jgi:glycosyltransferase involved in cell wall biosynthesis
VEDGVSGYLLPVGATDAMAEAGVRILKDDALRRKMRAAARKIAVEKFSADAIVPQYEALYERVLAGGTGA